MRRLALAGPRLTRLIHCCLFCAICGHSGPLFHCRCVVHWGVAYGIFTWVGDGWRTGGAGVVYSGSLKVATVCHCGGCFNYFVWPGLRVALGRRRGVQLSRRQQSLPVLVSLYFPCQCMQWNGFQRFHCSVSNGLVAEVHIFVVGAVGRGYIDRQVSLSFF